MTEPLSQAPQTSPRPVNGRLAEDPHTLDHPTTGGNARFDRDAESPPGTPRWVKIFGIAAIIFVLLVAGLHLTGNTPTHGMPTEHSSQMP